MLNSSTISIVYNIPPTKTSITATHVIETFPTANNPQWVDKRRHTDWPDIADTVAVSITSIFQLSILNCVRLFNMTENFKLLNSLDITFPYLCGTYVPTCGKYFYCARIIQLKTTSDERLVYFIIVLEKYRGE